MPPQREVEPGPGKSSRRARRQELIADQVLSKGAVSAQELAERFEVSVMTVHRDLDELERQGVLRKSRGTATAQPSSVFESNVAYRLNANLPAKRAIARQAARHVEPGMSVLLDDSTTTLEMVPPLTELAPLQIATNYRAAIDQLITAKGIGLMALGGDYDAQHDSFLGVMCVEAVQSIRVDAVFVSTSAVSGGFAYHQEQRIVTLKRVMLDVATRRYLLLDHTKLGRVALHRLVPLSEFDLVIVDADTPEKVLADLDQYKVRVEVADRDREPGG